MLNSASSQIFKVTINCMLQYELKLDLSKWTKTIELPKWPKITTHCPTVQMLAKTINYHSQRQRFSVLNEGKRALLQWTKTISLPQWAKTIALLQWTETTDRPKWHETTTHCTREDFPEILRLYTSNINVNVLMSKITINWLVRNEQNFGATRSCAFAVSRHRESLT